MLQLAQAALKIAPCSISLVEGRFDELIRNLENHKLDLVISNFVPKLENTRGLHHKVISKKPVGIYGSSHFKQLRKNFPQSLQDKPIVLPTYDSQMRYDLEHWLKSNKINMDVVAETQDTALKKLMATESLAIIPAASHTVERQVLLGELILIGQMKNLNEELFLISAQRKIENPVANELMKKFIL
jgi:LysR family transcriptional activator of nhaA